MAVAVTCVPIEAGLYHSSWLITSTGTAGSIKIPNVTPNPSPTTGTGTGINSTLQNPGGTPPGFTDGFAHAGGIGLVGWPPQRASISEAFLAVLAQSITGMTLAQARSILLVGECQVDIIPQTAVAGWGIDAAVDADTVHAAIQVAVPAVGAGASAIIRLSLRHGVVGQP